MRQAALPQPYPGLIDTIAISDEDPSPVMNELRKRGGGTVCVDLKVGHCRIGHDPPPLPIPVQEPRRLVNVVHEGGTSHLANGGVMSRWREIGIAHKPQR